MSTLSLRKIKHDSAVVDNITLGSNGHVGIGTNPVDSFGFGKALDLASTSGAYVYLRDSDSTNGVGGIGYSGTDVYISNKAAGNIKFLCNNDATVRMNIDSAGYVTIPYQPAFSVTRSAGDIASGSTLIGNVVILNTGSHYNTSNGRFTAPVTGVYAFHCYFMASGSTNDSAISAQFFKNGSGLNNSVPYTRANGENFQGMAGHLIIPLNANDYIELRNSGSSGWYGTGTGHNAFSGHLIG